MSNTPTICGNLTREPEIRYTKEGQATAKWVWRSTGAGRTRPAGSGRKPRRFSTSSARVTWPRTWRSVSPRACASWSPAGSSSAAGRPTRVSTAPRSRSWPRKSVRRSFRHRRCAADSAPSGDGGALRVDRHRRPLFLRSASRAGSPGTPGGPTRGTRHRSDRKDKPCLDGDAGQRTGSARATNGDPASLVDDP